MATKTEVHHCECGRRRSRYMANCRKCHEGRMKKFKDEATRIVESGRCPECGTRLIRNNAIAGWWQCGAYACEQMRKPEFAGLPSCSFQTFTE